MQLAKELGALHARRARLAPFLSLLTSALVSRLADPATQPDAREAAEAALLQLASAPDAQAAPGSGSGPAHPVLLLEAGGVAESVAGRLLVVAVVEPGVRQAAQRVLRWVGGWVGTLGLALKP